MKYRVGGSIMILPVTEWLTVWAGLIFPRGAGFETRRGNHLKEGTKLQPLVFGFF